MGKQESVSFNPNTLTRMGLAAALAIGGVGVSSCAPGQEQIGCQAVGEWHPQDPLDPADYEASAKVLGVPVPQLQKGITGEVACSKEIGPNDGLVKVKVTNVQSGYADQCAVFGMRELGPSPPSSDTLGVIGVRMVALCPALPDSTPSALS